jgi:predicted CXXCH cytochrome family protein
MNAKALIIAGFLVALIPGPLSAQVIAGRINNTPHDLVIPFANDDAKGEICVFCHTPHGARTDIVAPLWNKPATGATYTTYDSTTMDGEVLTVGSVSVACLACHDGTQAMDSVINEPGTGFGDDGDLNALGVMPPFSAAQLTPDLSDDHPIGVQYGGFDAGSGKIDPDFKGTGEGLSTDVGSLGANRWWVDTSVGTTGIRDKTDMILFTRDNGGDQPFVECASCHDPHSGGGSPNFMRIVNTNSDVCLSCHVK